MHLIVLAPSAVGGRQRLHRLLVPSARPRVRPQDFHQHPPRPGRLRRVPVQGAGIGGAAGQEARGQSVKRLELERNRLLCLCVDLDRW